jgi:F-type H+-transporting ATPase subunit delta
MSNEIGSRHSTIGNKSMAKTKHNSTTSLVYAQSLLDLAKERNAAESIGEDLKAIGEGLRTDPGFKLFVIDPSISTEKRAAAIQKAFGGKVDQLLLNFLGVLNLKGRLPMLPEISDAYQSLLDEMFGKIEVDVTVAQKLSPEELSLVQQRVSTALGKSAVVHQYVDENIIGGLVLRVQDRLIDASVKYQLTAIKEQLLAARASKLKAKF